MKKGDVKRGKQQRDIKIQTVSVREIKQIVETEGQITGSERTERGGLNRHMTELLGRPGFTLKTT